MYPSRLSRLKDIFLFGFVLLAHVVLVPAALAEPPRYRIQHLGTFPDANYDQSQALGINDAGMVVGSCTGSSFPYLTQMAFRWTQAGGMDALTQSTAVASAVNNAGQVAGWLHVSPGFPGVVLPHAVRWEADGSFTNLQLSANLGNDSGTFYSISQGNAINGAGRVAGIFNSTGGIATYWNTDAHALFLPPVISFWAPSVATGVNDSGIVVGTAPEDGSPRPRNIAFRYNVLTGFRSLHPAGNYQSSAAAGVNNAGQVVGTVRVSDGGGGSHSEITLWDAGGNPQFLGAGSGVAINASGTVLGYNETLRHPVIWTAADGTTDLISLIDNGTGWTDLYATCINRSGQIAGYGTYAGKTRAFLLTPASSSVDLPASTLALTTFVPGASEAVAVDGIVCDNLRGMAKAWTTENETANKLVISLPAEYAGATVTAELASPGSSSGEVRAVGDKIVYYPPDEYNENQEPTSAENGQITLSAKRTVTLRVRFTHNGRSYVVADKPLLLARAPVVLVHGIQSDPSRWQPLVNALNERGIHVPFVGVNHADVLRGNGPVEIAAKKLRDNVLSAIDAIHNGRDVSGINGSVFSDYHGLKLASRRADVVAWSYGGVITRWYIASTGSSASYAWYHPPIPPDGQSTLNFDADNRPIRKVITLGSMWRGVPLINYLNEASYPATQTRAQLRNAPLTTPVVSSTVGNVIARLPLPYSAPSMEVMAIGSKWMSQLVYGSPTYGESAAPFDEKIAYGAVAGDDNRYPIEIPEIKFVGHVGSLFLDIYGMLNFFQQPTYFPYLTLETRGFGTGNYSDGLVPVWSASIPSTRDMLLGSNKIIPVSHDSYPANIDTQMYVIRALNHSGLEQGRALNVLWNDAERSRIRTRDGTKTWSFASGQIAPYPQSDFYQQIDGIGRLNPFAFGERSVIVPLVKVAKKRTFNNEIEFTVTIGNGGFVLIPDVKVEGAILASGSSVVPPLTPLPQSLGTINLGQSVITNIRFPSIGPVNAPAVLKLRMSATILSEFNRNISITLP